MRRVLLKLASGYWIRRPSPDKVVFLSPGRAVVFRGNLTKLLADSLLPLLDGRRTATEIQDCLTTVSPGIITGLLSQLRQKGLIEAAEYAIEVSNSTFSPAAAARIDLHPGNIAQLPDPVAERLQALCDSRTGILQKLEAVRHESSEPMIVQYRAVGYTNLQSRPSRFVASGKDLDVLPALEAVLGESVERYSAGVYQEKSLVRATFRELGSSAMDPRSLVAFSPEQYRAKGFSLLPFSDAREYSWVNVHCLTGGDDTFVPAQFVYTPFGVSGSEPILWRSNTNGVAAALDKETSLSNALLEVVERDALMLAWYSRIGVSRIEIPSDTDSHILDLRERILSCELRVDCFRLPNEFGIPVSLAVIGSSRPDYPMVCVGCAASLSWGHAVYKSLLECLQVRASLRYRKTLRRTIGSPSGVRSISDHASYYSAQPDRLQAFDFLFDSRTVRLEEVAGAIHTFDKDRRLQECLNRVRGGGHEVYAINLAPPEIQSLGYQVFRVIVPGLIPIHFGHHRIPLGMQRLVGQPSLVLEWPHPMS